MDMTTHVLPIGSWDFVDVLQREPGARAKGRWISGMDGESEPLELQDWLRDIILGKNVLLSTNKACVFNIYPLSLETGLSS